VLSSGEMRSRGVTAFACVAAVLIGFSAAAQTVPYVLSPWQCGVIVWPNEVPDYADHFAQRLTEAAEAAFGFWGYPLPTTADKPYNEANCVLIFDPATQAEYVVPPLKWNGSEVLPVVVLAFSSEAAMRAAMGSTALHGAFWFSGPMNRLSFPQAQPWVWDVGGGYRNMVCASSASNATLIHEWAHWFTYQWGYSEAIAPHDLPNYIVEGIAEVTCAAEDDPHDAVYDRLQARAWAENNCLYASIDGVMQYAVGESFVNYLVEALGTDGFLGTLRTWTRRPLFMAGLYQADWRTSLDLPPDCPSGSD